MKPIKIVAMAVCAMSLLAMSASVRGQGLNLNFSANTGTEIQFNGSANSFQFNSAPGSYQWSIASETGGSSAIGLQGSVNNGPFSYGSITTSGSGISQVQYATVLGPLGQLVINDGGAGNLTGDVNWIDIATYSVSSGSLNATLTVNVTGISYSGSNPDLQYFVANQPGSLDVSFQFATAANLTSLSTGTGPYTTTSYSGSLSVVPEPSTLVIAGLSGFGLLLMRRRK